MNRTRTWTTPAGHYALCCMDMLQQPHLLIAGSTGSGKSTLINSLIYTALYNAPGDTTFILIDPKRVELIDYKPLPHCFGYASEASDIARVLAGAVGLMERRYLKMQKEHVKKFTGGHAYIIIDEFADLMTRQKRETLPHLQTLAQLGRAANMHLIVATQRPTKDIVTGQIKVNIDARVALRCPTAQDSRNIINVSGAELLPRYGFGYYLTPERYPAELVKIPCTPPEEIAARVKWWTDQTPPNWKR